MKKSLFMAAAMVATMAVSVVFSSCSKDDDVVTPDIVGVWEHYDTSGHYDQSKGEFYKIVLTFNADNTGTKQTEESYMVIKDHLSTWKDSYNFTYTQKGDRLEMKMTMTHFAGSDPVVREEMEIGKCRVEGSKLYVTDGLYPDGSKRETIFTRK